MTAAVFTGSKATLDEGKLLSEVFWVAQGANKSTADIHRRRTNAAVKGASSASCLRLEIVVRLQRPLEIDLCRTLCT